MQLNTINSILKIISTTTPLPWKQNTNSKSQQKAKWATFTYSSKEARKITKLMKDRKIGIAFRTRNSTKHVKILLRNIKMSEIATNQMKCLDCPLKYTGQTGRKFSTRYEHTEAIRNKNSNACLFIYVFISIYILLIHIRSTNLLDIEPVIM
jgi:hypothetical protein